MSIALPSFLSVPQETLISFNSSEEPKSSSEVTRESSLITKSPAFLDNTTSEEVEKLLNCCTHPQYSVYLIIKGKDENEFLFSYTTSQEDLQKTYASLTLTSSPQNVSFTHESNTFTASSIEELIDLLKQASILPSEITFVPLLPLLQKIKALFQSAYTRQKTIFPSKIQPFLEKFTNFSKKKFETLTLLFCRTMNTMLKDKSYDGLTVGNFLEEENNSGNQLYETDVLFRIEKSADGQEIRLMIIPPTPNGHLLLGQGTFKTVFALDELAIRPALKHVMTHNLKVLFMTQEDIKGRTCRSINEAIFLGFEIQAKLFPKISSPIELPHQLISGETLDDSLEWTQNYYPNLKSAIISHSIPLDFLKTKTKKLSTNDFFTLFLDVLLTLKEIHEAQHVHKDVKPENIVIRVEEPTQANIQKRFVRGLLTDYDLAQEQGASQHVSSDFCYWDTIARHQNLATSFCDIYGFAMSMLFWLTNGIHQLDGILRYPIFSDFLSIYKNGQKTNEEIKKALNDIKLKINHSLESSIREALRLIPGFTNYTPPLADEETIKNYTEQLLVHLDALEIPALYEAEKQQLKKDILLKKACSHLVIKIIKQDLIRARNSLLSEDENHSVENFVKMKIEENLTKKDSCYSSKDLYEKMQKIQKEYLAE